MQVSGARARVYVAILQRDGAIVTFGFLAVKSFSASDETEGLDVTNTEGVLGGGGGLPTVGGGTIGIGGRRAAADQAAALAAYPDPAGTGGFGWPPGGFASTTPAPRKARIELGMATFIDTVGSNPFLTPFIFEAARYYRIKIFPNRASNSGHLFPQALCTSPRHEMEVGQLQPVTLTFESDGAFFPYTNSGPTALGAG